MEKCFMGRKELLFLGYGQIERKTDSIISIFAFFGNFDKITCILLLSIVSSFD
jgi:hypothetical protein